MCFVKSQVRRLGSDWLGLSRTLKLLLRSNGRLSFWRSSISQDSSDLNNTNTSEEEVDGCQANEVSVYRKVTEVWERQGLSIGSRIWEGMV